MEENVYCVLKKNLSFEKLLFLTSFRSEPWDCMSRGEQGKPHAWEPVGHSTLTDWKKYSGILEFKLLH